MNLIKHSKKNFESNKLLEQCFFQKLENISDLVLSLHKYNEGDDIILGTFKKRVKDKDKIYYEISIKFVNKSNLDVVVFIKNIKELYLLRKSNQMILKRELTMAKLAHELKSPISTISLITEEIYSVKENEPEQGMQAGRNKYKRNSANKSKPDLNSELNQQVQESSGRSDKKIESVIEGDSNEGKVDNTHSITIINSLCNYLMILIEDLNSYVKLNRKDSNDSIHNEIFLQKEKLVDILNFCYLIFYMKQKFDPNKQNIKIELKYDNSFEDLKIMTNELKLKQMIINLLSNAYKFTTNGDVKLKADKNDKKKFIRISIVDSGCGLTEEEQQNLFKPFQQITKNQNLNSYGSGLGLTIVKEISKQLGLEIKIDSKLEVGTTFYFDISYKKKSQNQIKFVHKIEEIVCGKEKIKKPLEFIDNLFTRSNTSIKKVLVYESENLNKYSTSKFLYLTINY